LPFFALTSLFVLGLVFVVFFLVVVSLTFNISAVDSLERLSYDVICHVSSVVLNSAESHNYWSHEGVQASSY